MADWSIGLVADIEKFRKDLVDLSGLGDREAKRLATSYGNNLLKMQAEASKAAHEAAREQQRAAAETAKEAQRLAAETAREQARFAAEAAKEQERLARETAKEAERLAKEAAQRQAENGKEHAALSRQIAAVSERASEDQLGDIRLIIRERDKEIARIDKTIVELERLRAEGVDTESDIAKAAQARAAVQARASRDMRVASEGSAKSIKKVAAETGNFNKVAGVLRERANEMGGSLGKVGIAAGAAAAPLAALAVAGVGINKAVSIASDYQKELEALGRTPVIDAEQRQALEDFQATMREATLAGKEAVVIIGAQLADTFSGLAIVARDAARGLQEVARWTTESADAASLANEKHQQSVDWLGKKKQAIADIIGQDLMSEEEKINAKFERQNILLTEQIEALKRNRAAWVNRGEDAARLEREIETAEGQRAAIEAGRADAQAKRVEAEGAQAEALAEKKRAAYEKHAAAAKKAAEEEAAAARAVEAAQQSLRDIIAQSAADTLTAEDKIEEAWRAREASIQAAANASQDWDLMNAAQAANDERRARDLDALRAELAAEEQARREDAAKQAQEDAAAAEAAAQAERARAEETARQAIELAEQVRDASLAIASEFVSGFASVIDAVAEYHQGRLDQIREERAAAIGALDEERAAILEKWDTASVAEKHRLQERLAQIEVEKQAERKAANEQAKQQKKALKAAFVAQKAAALVRIAIDSAQAAIALIPAFAFLGPAAPAAAAGVAGIAGAIQAGIVLAQKPPTFHTGTGRVGGGGMAPDEVTAVLKQDEGVLTGRGVAAVGGPKAVEAANRGAGPQVVVVAQFGTRQIEPELVSLANGDGAFGDLFRSGKKAGASRVFA